MITTITNEKEYRDALSEFNRLWDEIPAGDDGSHPSIPRFIQLAEIIEAYEANEWPGP